MDKSRMNLPKRPDTLCFDKDEFMKVRPGDCAPRAEADGLSSFPSGASSRCWPCMPQISPRRDLAAFAVILEQIVDSHLSDLQLMYDKLLEFVPHHCRLLREVTGGAISSLDKSSMMGSLSSSFNPFSSIDNAMASSAGLRGQRWQRPFLLRDCSGYGLPPRCSSLDCSGI
uniref:Uncharacterized protein n=1 Tax=Rangifer tarandus platyrhynchus TaxID=3082113 RepID=A0ACB0FDM4_RANTA|nr:unnamed protein product [Rangifer tarandus platyrhynchus]